LSYVHEPLILLVITCACLLAIFALQFLSTTSSLCQKNESAWYITACSHSVAAIHVYYHIPPPPPPPHVHNIHTLASYTYTHAHILTLTDTQSRRRCVANVVAHTRIHDASECVYKCARVLVCVKIFVSLAEFSLFLEVFT
jgi:hypothetical protein